mgnify:CR=1 FL=1
MYSQRNALGKRLLQLAIALVTGFALLARRLLAKSDDYADLAENYMAQPRPVHFFAPQPGLLEDVPVDLEDLSVDVSMTVTSYGDVRYVEVLNPPEGLTDNHLGQIKRDVRQTPFRPALKAGEVVTTKEFIWQYAIAAQGQAS